MASYVGRRVGESSSNIWGGADGRDTEEGWIWVNNCDEAGGSGEPYASASL